MMYLSFCNYIAFVVRQQNLFFKYGPIPASFSLFSSFSHQNSITNWKKHRWCAWDSNLGPQDGRHHQVLKVWKKVSLYWSQEEEFNQNLNERYTFRHFCYYNILLTTFSHYFIWLFLFNSSNNQLTKISRALGRYLSW